MRHIVTVFFVGCSMIAFTQPQNTLVSQLKTAKDDTGKVSILLKISRDLQYSNWDSAIYYSMAGIRLAKKLNYTLGEARHTAQLGTIHEKHDNLDVARRYLQSSLQKYRALNDTLGIACQLNSLGIVEGKKGKFNTATNYFITALRLFEKIGNRSGIIQCYIKLGVVNELNNKLDKALQYYLYAKKLNGSDAAGLYPLLNNIGVVEAKRGNLKKALRYFEEGSKMKDSVAFASAHVNLMINAANALHLMGQNGDALIRNKLALQKAKNYNLPEAQSRILLNLSKLENKNNLLYLDEALRISRKIGNKQLEAEILQAIGTYQKDRGSYKESLAAFEKYQELLDTLFNINKEKEIAGLQAAYELEKSNERIRNLELSNEKRTLERNAGIVTILCVLLALGGLWYYLHKVRMLNARLKESNTVKDKLFSTISHDLRTPLAGIVQMMNVLESGLLSRDETRELLQSLKQQSQASLETMNALLLWGKTQLQGINVCKTTFRCKPVVEQTVALFSNQTHQKSLSIRDQVPDELYLSGDIDHFHIIIRNLFSNAIKFSYPHGIISITVSTTSQPGYAVFAIRDQGKGMKEELHKKLFKPLACSDDGTEGEKGTGLGLILCKDFVEANGGKIWCESVPASGSVFYFSMPCILPAPTQKELNTTDQRKEEFV